MKKKKILKIIFVFSLIFAFWVYLGNVIINVTEYEVISDEIPKEFEGFRIVQISDLHNDSFGNGESRLLKKVIDAKPDIILITGDFIDYYHTDVEVAVSLLGELVEIAPTYYTSGNHESRLPEELAVLTEKAEELGVHILRNGCEYIEHNGSRVEIIGVEDPAFIGEKSTKEEHTEYIRKNYTYLADNTSYKILLCHRPEQYELYCELSVDLVFSGHAHGGQFRLPFIGGILAPSQGTSPKYSEGIHSNGKTIMIVSRGLGNSSFPFRINNNPELVVATLKSA